jgi:hypothetical protein
MTDLTNILQSDDELNEEQLKKYLSGEANAEELHAVEKTMADNEFVNDAIEGLQDFSSQAKLNDYVEQLNKKLHQHLEQPKERKRKREIRNLSLIIIAVTIILIICVISYWIIKIQREKENQKKQANVEIYTNISNNKFIL